MENTTNNPAYAAWPRNIELTQQTIEVGSRGQTVKLDCAVLSDDILRQLLIHGAIQKIGDAASAAKATAISAHFGDTEPNKSDAKAWTESPAGEAKIGEVALAMMQKAVTALVAGQWAIREGTGIRIRRNDVDSLAIDMAKETLKNIFVKATAERGKKPTMENFVGLGDAVAKYFVKGEKAYVWEDDAVLTWIDSQAASGKTDYRQAAREEIARRAAMTEEVDVSALLADI